MSWIEKVFKAARDESYFHLIAISFEKKIEEKYEKKMLGQKSEALYMHASWKKVKHMRLQSTDTAFTQHLHDKYSSKQKVKSRQIKRCSKGTCNS